MQNQDNNQPSNNTVNVTVVSQPKSVAVSLLLTFFLGPLGMLYSTILGGIIMFFVSIILGFLTLGLSFFITQPICLVWGVVSVNSYNKRQIERQVERQTNAG